MFDALVPGLDHDVDPKGQFTSAEASGLHMLGSYVLSAHTQKHMTCLYLNLIELRLQQATRGPPGCLSS